MNQTDKITCFDWSLLTNRDIVNKYTVTVRNKFDTLQEISETHTPNDEYENFISAYMKAVAECIPTEPRTKYKVPRETLAVRKKRDDMELEF